jgi:protein-S-isoprenylcysteine O-methyltransferase Ste14
MASRMRTVDFAKLQRSRIYDALMRLPVLAWCVVSAMAWMAQLTRYMREAAPAVPDAVYAINVAMRLTAIAYLLLLSASVILRGRPLGKARGVEPRVSALIGGFLMVAVVYFPRRELSPSAAIVSTLLILLGCAFSLYVLTQLGRSFSVMAEARRLVTSGIYRFVRHPLYLAEEISTIGLLLQFLSPWTLLLLVVQITFQLRRMHNEEVILGEIFPEYAAYKARTARLIPGIY